MSHSIRSSIKKITSAYDLAGYSRRLGNWNPITSSINSLLSSSLESLHSCSHDIVRKNPYARNAIESIVSNCIGTGIKPQSKAKNAEFQRKCTALQHNLMVYQFCRPVWNKWLELAILSGAIDMPNDSTFSLVKWILQGFAWGFQLFNSVVPRFLCYNYNGSFMREK